mmetsp:Transcript_42294/g.62200  ORF Transcript_42294/g.62200 Transcript_42294/m.62200 type:complete len:128 (-) Transcript_42294:214-597(-)
MAGRAGNLLKSMHRDMQRKKGPNDDPDDILSIKGEIQLSQELVVLLRRNQKRDQEKLNIAQGDVIHYQNLYKAFTGVKYEEPVPMVVEEFEGLKQLYEDLEVKTCALLHGSAIYQMIVGTEKAKRRI